MCVNKTGKEQFLVKWVGYPLNEATWEPFKNLSGEEACEYLVILYSYNQTLVFIYVTQQTNDCIDIKP